MKEKSWDALHTNMDMFLNKQDNFTDSAVGNTGETGDINSNFW